MNKKIKVVALIVARNEEEFLPKTISALKNQYLKPELIVLVDDGSTDNTASIGKKFGCHVISLPYHKESHVGMPELASVINQGLSYISKFNSFDYLLILGADHVLPPNYIKDIVKKMEEDKKIVIASGSIIDEPFTEDSPRGSGRIIRIDFWKELNGMQFPVNYGWESWLVLKARQQGYEAICFNDIKTRIQRKTSYKGIKLGKAMYALGYYWLYAVGRCFLTFLNNPVGGIMMFVGWAFCRDIDKLDIAEWVNKTQRKIFWQRIKRIIKKWGRK